MANGDCPIGSKNGAKIEVLEREMSEVKKGVHDVETCMQTIISDERLRNSGWARWEKVGLALLTTLGAPLVLLIVVWLLSNMGGPMVHEAAAAAEALTR